MAVVPELIELVFVGSTRNELDDDDDEVEDPARVQSSQALPLSDGQIDPANFRVEEELDNLEDEECAAIGIELEVKASVVPGFTDLEEVSRVEDSQSSQAPSLSEGQADPENFLVEVELDNKEDMVCEATGAVLVVEDSVVAWYTGREVSCVEDSQSFHCMEKLGYPPEGRSDRPLDIELVLVVESLGFVEVEVLAIELDVEAVPTGVFEVVFGGGP